MKRNKIVSLLIISLFLILAACGKKDDPEEVATAFIESTIYYKNSETAEKYFYQLNGTQEKDLAENFKTSFNLTDEQAKELVTIYSDKLNEETSFSTEVTDDKDKTKTVEVTIVGLDQSQFEQTLEEQTDAGLVKFLQTNGHPNIKQIADIDQISETDELEKLSTTLENMTDENYAAIQYEALKAAFQSLKANKESNQKVQMQLKPDDKEKKYWQIVDEEETFTKLFNAFQG